MALATGKFKSRSVVNIGSQYGVVVPNPNLYSDPSKELSFTLRCC